MIRKIKCKPFGKYLHAYLKGKKVYILNVVQINKILKQDIDKRLISFYW